MAMTSTAATAAATAATTAAAMVAGAWFAGAASPIPTTSVAAVMASPQWMAAGSEVEIEEQEIEEPGNAQSDDRNLGEMHAGKRGTDGDNPVQNFAQPYLGGKDTQVDVDAAKNKIKEALQTLGLTHTEQGKQLMLTIAKQSGQMTSAAASEGTPALIPDVPQGPGGNANVPDPGNT